MATLYGSYKFTETTGRALGDDSGNSRTMGYHDVNGGVERTRTPPNSYWQTEQSGSELNEDKPFSENGIFYFDGSHLFLRDLSPNLSAMDFSLSFWIYPTTDMSDNDTIFSTRRSASNDGDFQISTLSTGDGGSTNELFMFFNSTYKYSLGTVTTNAWNNIIITYDHNNGNDSNLRPYLNGTGGTFSLNQQIAPTTNGPRFYTLKLGVNRNVSSGGNFLQDI